MNDCRCSTSEAALQCRRAGVPMVPVLHALCQTRADYRALWDGLPRTEDGREFAPQLSGPDKLKACRHRSRAVRGPLGRPLLTLDRLG